jgi:hypothetical protein
MDVLLNREPMKTFRTAVMCSLMFVSEISIAAAF